MQYYFLVIRSLTCRFDIIVDHMLDLKFGITNDLNRLMHRYILVHHQYHQDSGDLEFRVLQYFPF